MKAIETRYKGYRFRSRLEARWAVFFDALHLKWEYEKEGYEFAGGIKYLPDFWLPGVDGGTWIEVKGENPGWPSDAIDKLRLLCDSTGMRGLLVIGEPYGNLDYDMIDSPTYDWITCYPEGGADNCSMFCLCPWCGRIGVAYEGRGARVCGWRKHHATEAEALAAIRHLGHWRADDKCYTFNAPIIEAAALAARQARFEHGENGAAR